MTSKNSQQNPMDGFKLSTDNTMITTSNMLVHINAIKSQYECKEWHDCMESYHQHSSYIQLEWVQSDTNNYMHMQMLDYEDGGKQLRNGITGLCPCLPLLWFGPIFYVFVPVVIVILCRNKLLFLQSLGAPKQRRLHGAYTLAISLL